MLGAGWLCICVFGPLTPLFIPPPPHPPPLSFLLNTQGTVLLCETVSLLRDIGDSLNASLMSSMTTEERTASPGKGRDEEREREERVERERRALHLVRGEDRERGERVLEREQRERERGESMVCMSVQCVSNVH